MRLVTRLCPRPIREPTCGCWNHSAVDYAALRQSIALHNDRLILSVNAMLPTPVALHLFLDYRKTIHVTYNPPALAADDPDRWICCRTRRRRGERRSRPGHGRDIPA